VNASQSLDDVAHEAKVDLHTEHRVAAIDERVFSGFLEHMGRAVYQGVFDPGSPLSDERGLRRDVLDALSALGSVSFFVYSVVMVIGWLVMRSP
jgi:alpha-L-arabinofuranosidase